MKNIPAFRFRSRRPILFLMVLLMGALVAHSAGAQDFGLGDVPLDPETYNRYLKSWERDSLDAIPTSYDARSEGIVTSPKNQGSCGSCWSFAATGAFESHLLKQFGYGPTDLSEQQQVSCNLTYGGCCGGSMGSIQYWETQGPIYESCFPYGESSVSCPTQRTVSCTGAAACEQIVSRVINYYTVPDDPAQMKTSLYNDGPSYWRYNVYSDFSDGYGGGFWNDAGPGDVYTNIGDSSLRGGHAVLIIGYDDAKGAYLCKNSWGATGGPNGDGTFWIAYTGHYHNLGFQMANFNLDVSPVVEADGMYEVRMDNTDPGHTQTGTWYETTASHAYATNTMHYAAAGSGDTYFRFVMPGSLECGHYAVYARWPANAAYASDTRYEVWYDVGVAESVRVNQQADDARWVRLGSWDVCTSSRLVVRVYNDANSWVIADGVRFVRLGPSAATPATLDNAYQGPADFTQ